MAEMADVSAARLDRKGQVEGGGDPHGGGAVGIEKLCVNDIELLTVHCREDRTRDLRRVEACPVARDQREAWAMDSETIPRFLAREGAQRPVTGVQRAREGRQANRRGDGQLGARLSGERAQTFFDK